MTHADTPDGLDTGPEAGPEINDLTDARSPLARTLISVGVSLVVGLVLVGLVLGIGRLTRTDDVETAQFTADPTQPLRFVVDGLDVHLVPTEGSVITVEAHLVEGWLDTDFEATQDAGDISLRASCPALVIPGCGGEVTIGIPSGTQFELETAGSDVTLDGVDGVATVRTTTGDIHGHDLGAVEVTTTTTSGDIDLEFAVDPAGLKATTDSGDVDITIPGEAGYDIVTTTDSGEVDTPAETGAGEVESFIAIETISGDIDLDLS